MVMDQDSTESTALHLAVENGSYDVAKLCIEKGTLLSESYIEIKIQAR